MNSVIYNDKNELQMTNQGKFILMAAVNIFLCQDYSYTRRICSTNFSYVANTSLFEGNILRINALASEQLYLARASCKYLDDDERMQNIASLFAAIQSATNALDIYNCSLKATSRNIYGYALQNF